MIGYSFREFISAYNDGSIQQHASWRGYCIPEQADSDPDKYATYALKKLRYRCAKDRIMSYARIAADYDITTPDRARLLLALWFIWQSVAHGTRLRGLKERTSND